MRHLLTGVLAACVAIGAVIVVAQPALPAVRHLAIDHSPAPPLAAVEISNAALVATPITLPSPPPQPVCTSCPPPNTGACGACPPQPTTVRVGLVQIPL
jgi:hypothetical protein